MAGTRKSLAGVSLVALALAASPAMAKDRKPDEPTTRAASTKELKPLYRNVRAFYRNVRAFWGDVNPFYRNVRAFWGDVDPFYRNVRAFWGTMDPVTQATRAGAPAYSGVGAFWDGLGSQWEGIAGQWQTAGSYDDTSAQTYANVALSLNQMINSSKDFWGSAVNKQTKKSFEAGFSTPILSRYGINLNDPSSLASISPTDQSAFFLEWYDGLMEFAGTDHADWWMKSSNWSPAITQTMGSGRGVTIGLVDMFVSNHVSGDDDEGDDDEGDDDEGAIANYSSFVGDPDLQSKVKYSGGASDYTNGHGSGVLSLIVASHDGKGIMGIAPGANVAVYNPFDSTGSADWSDVLTGIRAVTKQGASVVNLSLGAPGYTLHPEWKNVLGSPQIASARDKTLYVLAAGNDGVTQTGDVDMTGALSSTFIVVGSLGPNDEISEFSNRPGDVCLLDRGVCKGSTQLDASGYLKNRFIVAPGELILVSDGAGGVTRQSGTSLAAPLVSGAIALIQDRWPWLKSKPGVVAKIILDSAKDLGAPGVDEVYGVGALDIEAAMSPLDFNKLRVNLTTSSGKSLGTVPVSSLRSSALQSVWSATNMYFTAFETVDRAERDFLIPLSTRLYGTTRNGEYFQDFVYNRMVSWMGTTGFANGAPGFVQGTQAQASVNGWTMQMAGRLVNAYDSRGRASRTQLRSTVSLKSPEGGFGIAMGQGDGAIALGGGHGLSLAADFDPYSGGTNPLLGFASGGAHAAAQVAVSRGLDVRFGFTEQRERDLEERSRAFDGDGRISRERYRASAMSIDVGYSAAPWLRVSASATSLREPNALLGVRSQISSDLTGGSRTSSFTLGADAAVGSGVSLFGSGTIAKGQAGRSDATLRIGADGLSATSFQVGIAKAGLFSKSDAVRLTVAQPLHLTGGSLELSELQVIDRQTGETGLVTQRFSLSDMQPRRLVLEGNYGTPVFNGQGQVSLFGRGEMRDVEAGTPRLMVGSQLQLAF